MPRPRTGSTFVKDGIRQIAVTTWRPNAKAPRWVRPCPRGDDGAELSAIEAKKIALDMQRDYDAEPPRWDPWAPKAAPVAPAAETFAQYCDRVHAHRAAHGHRSVRDDRYRLGKWVMPRLGAKPVASITADDVTAVRDALTAAVLAETVSGKQALNVWATLTVFFKTACARDPKHLHARADNPCAGIAPPAKGTKRRGTILFPSEFLALAACPAVPRELVDAVAVALYSATRAGETEALEVTAVDLVHNLIEVHHATDADTGELVGPKTDAGVRPLPIEPALRPLLEALTAEARAAGRTRLLGWMPPRRTESELLRQALRTAGVTREALFADDARRRPFRWHDLRASAITWMAVRGDSALAIVQRVGHEDLGSTKPYLRLAQAYAATFGTPFPPLPARLLADRSATGSATTPPARGGSTAENPRRSEVRGTGLEPPPLAAPDDTTRLSEQGEGEGAHHATPAGRFATGSATTVAHEPDTLFGHEAAALTRTEARAVARLARGALWQDVPDPASWDAAWGEPS